MAELYYVDWDGLVYYDGKIKQHISDELENCIKMGGIVTFDNLPDPSFSNLNYIYKITEDFVSNTDFEVPGLIYKAGTWVQVTDLNNVYLYTIFDEVVIGETADLTGYATEQFVEDKISEIEIPEVPTKVSAFENDAGYLTEHQSLEGYAKVTDIPDVSNFATKEEIPSTDGLATETYVDEAVSGIAIPDTSNFITMEDVESKGYITEHQDLSDYALKSEIPSVGDFITADTVANYIPSEYVTSDELAEAINEIEHPSIPTKVSDLENDLGYITEVASDDSKLDVAVYEEDKKSFITDVSDKADKEHKHSIGDIEDYVAPDLSEYAKKAEIPTDYLTEEDLNGYSKFSGSYNDLTDKPEIPSIDGLATEEFVNNAVDSIEIPDISGKADVATTLGGYGITDAYTRTEIDAKLLELGSNGSIDEETLKGFVSEDEWNERIQGYALKSEIPQDYLKEIPDEYITADELAAEGFIKEHQSLEGYAKISDIPTVPSKVSELTNDSNFITADALSDYAKSSDIPTDYIKEIPSEYVTETELSEKGYLTEHQDITGKADKDHSHSYNDLTDKPTIPSLNGYATEDYVNNVIGSIDIPVVPTKVSEFENDAGYITEHQSLEEYAKKADLTGFITMSDVEGKNYLVASDIEGKLDASVYNTEKAEFALKTEIPTDYLTSDDLDGYSKFSGSYNDLTDKPTIPSIDGLATEQFVADAINNIDIPTVDTSTFVTTDTLTNELEKKADSVLFTDDQFVNNAVGGFIIGDSVKGLTIAQIIVKLLDLKSTVTPEEPDAPQGVIASIIANRMPMYSQDESGNLVETAFDYTTWTEEEASVRMDGISTFYQIVDDADEVIESGYQEATDYQEEAWLTIALPSSVTNFKVEQFDGLRNDWFEVGFEMVQADDQHIDGYTIWTVPEEYEEISGSTYRFIIIE